ncbi:hypothetical protein C8Q74DRAFT_358708 [Fomes fomentarius]|nr:hypothetical protein C8Q74DRAFT_358708 [Fomes fomentarius]
MLARPFFIFSVLTSALALSTQYARARGGKPRVREYAGADFDEQDLFNSCPGGPGSQKLERADRCTLINIVNNTDYRVWVVLGDPQLNCKGGEDNITVTLTGSQTVEQITNLNGNIGVDIGPIVIGGGMETASSTTTTETTTKTYTVPPGRQAVYVGGTAYVSQTGNIQVNYGDRQYGHYIWYTGTTVTRLTPIPDDVDYDVYESACGTDPRDLSKYNPQPSS